jgi:hypothetical protein
MALNQLLRTGCRAQSPEAVSRSVAAAEMHADKHYCTGISRPCLSLAISTFKPQTLLSHVAPSQLSRGQP